MNKGFAIHCHHNVLVEYCYDYKERVKAIKRDKPVAEQEIRLRLFKMLPKPALKDTPIEYQEAYQKWQEAYQEWQEAYWKWQKADQEWSQVDRDAFHKKWCGCSEWTGTEINFREKK